jgi:hypothetical protein
MPESYTPPNVIRQSLNVFISCGHILAKDHFDVCYASNRNGGILMSKKSSDVV